MNVHLTTASPVGPLRLTSDGSHLTGVYFAQHRHAPQDLGPEVGPSGAPPVLGEAVSQLQAYFTGELRAFDLPLAASGSEFQRLVWAQLALIPYGRTWSYGELARAVGRPGAARAVGLANGRNPISIVVPCHRVIATGGAITGYGGGVVRKQQLLDLEARARADVLF